MTLLLVLCAGVYSVLALRRRSFGFGAVALLFANGGFWYWLQHDLQRALLEHPQLWLLPPALCVLVRCTSESCSTVGQCLGHAALWLA